MRLRGSIEAARGGHVDDPITWWRSLTGPWKAFIVTFLGGLLAFGLTGWDLGFAFVNALLWGVVVGGIVRLVGRLRSPPGR